MEIRYILVPAACLLVILNAVAFFLMGYDKRCAKKGKWRVSEKSLFIAAGCFGGLGGVLGMRVFRHKTQHWYFRIFFPVMLAIQIVILAAGAYYIFFVM